MDWKKVHTPVRLLVCGDRNWKDMDIVLSLFQRLRAAGVKVEVVIDGAARGADSLGHMVARQLALPCNRYPADWNKYGRGAGPIRNRQMLDEGKPNLVVAFHDRLEDSKGTRNMVRQALKAGVMVLHYSHNTDVFKEVSELG